MAKLYLATNYVSNSALATGQLKDSGHLQLVFEDDAGKLTELEVQSPPEGGLFGGDWLFLGGDKERLHGGGNTDYTDADGNSTNNDRYKRIELPCAMGKLPNKPGQY